MAGRQWITFLLVFVTCWKIHAEPAGFYLQRVVFINAATDGFGLYHLRANNIFEEGDNLSLYLEPVNCSIKKVSQGFKAELSAVANLKSVTNPALSQELQIGKMEFIFPNKDMGLYADINLLDVGMLPIDLYQLDMTIQDQATGQSVQFSRKFRVGPSYVEAVLTESDSLSYSDDLKSKSGFSRETAKIYCLFHTRRIPKNARLDSHFYAESVAGLKPDCLLKNYSTQVERYQNGKIILDYPETGWGIGNYRLEIYINDEFEIVLFFQVE